MNLSTLRAQLYLLAIFTCWAAKADMFKSSMSEFREFEIKYNKMYSSPQEREARYAVFVNNLAKIQSHNSKPNVSWTMGINQFTDMTSKGKDDP